MPIPVCSNHQSNESADAAKEHDPSMGSSDDAKALAEGQRAAGSVTPFWGHATTQKLWPKANARLEGLVGGDEYAGVE